MKNKFRKIKEFASQAEHRNGRTYYLVGKFDKLNASPKWPYGIFKSKESTWTKRS